MKFLSVFSKDAMPYYDQIKQIQSEGRSLPALLINGRLVAASADLDVNDVLSELNKAVLN